MTDQTTEALQQRLDTIRSNQLKWFGSLMSEEYSDEWKTRGGHSSRTKEAMDPDDLEYMLSRAMESNSRAADSIRNELSRRTFMEESK